MLAKLTQLFRASSGRPLPAVPPGERIYAVGDIHGRADLFAALIEAVEADDAARDEAQSTVILLGDLVDRGPDSAGVIALARAWNVRRQLRCIAGNHEEMFLESLTDIAVLRHFLRFGGRETLLSYPIDPVQYAQAELEECQAMILAAVPAEDFAFLRTMEDQIAVGDYLFVHAGIRPDVALPDQRTADLRWIREPFLSHREPFGPVVVHGHTITKKAEFHPNRIAVDTGAYQSGRLTALGLEGTARWLVTASDEAGEIACTVSNAK